MINRIFVGLISLLSLGGCAVSTGFKGPGYSSGVGVTLPGEGPVLVVLTEAELGGDGDLNRQFWDHVGRIDKSMGNQPGLIGYALRRELLGKKGWTMTAWRDRDSLMGFVYGVAHQDAMDATRKAPTRMVFAQIEVPRGEIPLSWDRALTILAEKARGY